MPITENILIHSIKKAVELHYQEPARKITPLGGGFYGRVYLVDIEKEPYKVVYKGYLYPGFSRKEELQLKTLAQYSTLKVPKVYFVEEAGDLFEADLLVMEYIEGVNAGEVFSLDEAPRKVIADEMIENLLACHRTVHREGFGSLDAEHFVRDWRDYYYPLTDMICKKTRELYDSQLLSTEIVSTVERAFENYWRIFYLPITDARLIHGDYNTWNLLLTKDKTHTAAVIDPFGCCWADPEFDLYQLDNANGKMYGLLDLYRKKQRLSENFDTKRQFYELYTEINHYYDSHVTPSIPALEEKASLLREQMKKMGIPVT